MGSVRVENNADSWSTKRGQIKAYGNILINGYLASR
jgi:hypothetical protein